MRCQQPACLLPTPNMRMDAQIATRQNIIELRDFWLKTFEDRPELMKQMANHFTTFDPANTDYSSLTGN